MTNDGSTEKNWFHPANLMDLEKALDGQNGLHLFCELKNGKYWQARRNGATKRWKKDATRFRVPIKYGFYGYYAITETDALTNFRVAASRKLAEGEG